MSAALARPTLTSRDVRAGCFVCHGGDAGWFGGQSQGTAAQHHDRTGHATWCDVVLMVRYGADRPDPRQIDIEDSISAASAAEPGNRPVSIPRPNPDAPADPAAGVSAPEGRSSRSALAAEKPEHAHV